MFVNTFAQCICSLVVCKLRISCILLLTQTYGGYPGPIWLSKRWNHCKHVLRRLLGSPAMLGYVARPTFGEVDDNAPADSLVCDLWIMETKFGPLFWAWVWRAVVTGNPLSGPPCERANGTENRNPRGDLWGARRIREGLFVSVLFPFNFAFCKNNPTCRWVAGVAKRRIDAARGKLSIGGIVYVPR